MQAAEPALDLLLRVRGTVQGVGFRPFVYRTASRLQLGGWVRNDQQGVLIRAIGSAENIAALEQALREELPSAAHVLSIEEQAPGRELPAAHGSFTILESDAAGEVEASIPPDLALCAECRAELGNPLDRRYRYPFINCTQCGPRYSIVEALPYDRPKTTMRAFRMCPACQREYDDPGSRRFHAQPNACPACGPSVRLAGCDAVQSVAGDVAVREAAQRIAAGQIVALRGIGGYHLLVDATNDAAVQELRRRKHRDEKPFAVMFAGLDDVERFAEVNDAAIHALTSNAAPIVLLPRRPEAPLARSVAPDNPWVGAILAYAPLHVLLLEAVGRPLVATSGNLADEPLCTDPDEAHRRLVQIADVFLDHDRPIAHPVDDSVLRLAKSGNVLLRRARGYAPSPLKLPGALPGKWLCVGAQMKNTLAVAAGDRVVVSPHIGDLGGAATAQVFQHTARTLAELHGGGFTAVACDKHPDYASSRYADELGLPGVKVQHHLAHVLACLLENRRAADGVLGVVWDGTGYGEDGTIWGGEFLLLRENSATRFGRLHPFQIPGGEAAIRDPRRVALGLFHAAEELRQRHVALDLGFSAPDAAVLWRMLERHVNSPITSSAGRLFDGIGALIGVGQRNQYEGQTPLRVEAAAMAGSPDADLLAPMPIIEMPPKSGARFELDWRPLLESLLAERRRGTHAGDLAAAFHRTLANGIVAMARCAGVGTIALSGGCFQNARLLDLTVEALRAERFDVLTHRELPPNDGNIAVGQALGALWNLTTVTPP